MVFTSSESAVNIPKEMIDWPIPDRPFRRRAKGNALRARSAAGEQAFQSGIELR